MKMRLRGRRLPEDQCVSHQAYVGDMRLPRAYAPPGTAFLQFLQVVEVTGLMGSMIHNAAEVLTWYWRFDLQLWLSVGDDRRAGLCGWSAYIYDRRSERIGDLVAMICKRIGMLVWRLRIYGYVLVMLGRMGKGCKWLC